MGFSSKVRKGTSKKKFPAMAKKKVYNNKDKYYVENGKRR